MPHPAAWKLVMGALALTSLGLAGPVLATPSTVFWAPATPALQPFGVLHVTYDTYFRNDAAYPIDTGLTMGVLPGNRFQFELGFDVNYPTFSAGEPLSVPILLNGKVGAPEDAYFKGSPGWSVGILGVGFEEDVTDYNVLHAMLGKTFSPVGSLSVGGYYGLNKDLFRSSNGEEERVGLMAGWLSPSIDVPLIEKLQFAWDLQTGENAFGATGGGAYIYLTPTTNLLLGPVFFFDGDLQPGGADWMWSIQFDADINLAP